MGKFRFTVNWTGFSGAPGYSHFVFGGVSDGGDDSLQVGRLRTFIQALQSYLPNDVFLSIEPSVQELDDNTGDVVGQDVITPGTALAGTDAGAYSAPNGAAIIWHTNVFRNSREVRGRTFLVPLAGSVFGADTGAPSAAVQSGITAAAASLAANVEGGMFIKTSAGAPLFVHVTGANCSPRAAILRSRRD